MDDSRLALAKTMPSLDTGSLEIALSRKDPITVEEQAGEADDALDRLPLIDDTNSLYDYWPRQVVADSSSNPDLTKIVDLYHLRGTDRERLDAFHNSGSSQALAELMSRFGIETGAAIADVGCGTGWLAYSLHKIGYSNLIAMEPDSKPTDPLKEIAPEIRIINDLGEWRELRDHFDALVSVGTVHHWHHIPWVALEARRTMKPGAYWFAMNEFIANTPEDFVSAMRAHPTRERYQLYEWAYPASAYVDLIQSVGLKLVAAVPFYYRRNAFIPGLDLPTPEAIDQTSFDACIDERLMGPNGTVELFWAEVDARRRRKGYRLFTIPQVLVFQRVSV